MASIFNPTKEELERLYQLYSCKAIGEQYGVCAEVVRKAIHRFGVVSRKRGTRRSFNPTKELLTELYQSMSMADMAKHFGVGETVVFKRLKEHGIELKEHKNHRLKTGKQFSEGHKAKIREARRKSVKFGEDNPNWRGGATEKNRLARNTWQYRDWKKLSIMRAGNKCELCGVVGGSMCDCCGVKIVLHVHHIKSFAKYPDLRFDPENSEVLCPKCHKARH